MPALPLTAARIFAVVVALAGAATASETRWIGVGGGADPTSSQVSLEQDLRLAREVFGPGGIVLFAGGKDAFGVQVLREEPTGDALRVELGELLDPRDGRRATYRKPAIALDGAATPNGIEAALARALADGDEPLLLYIAMHGEKGETPADNTVIVWGDFTLSVRRLAELLEATASRREVRVIVTACYSGGFAELAFTGADPDEGPAAGRCGLFAATADEISSGCDPNPDRRSQDAYGLHFLNALRRQDRHGSALPPDQIDFDGDGRISLLEAHTRARIAARTFDVPTTTSERWLRHRAAGSEADDRDDDIAISLPEETAVIRALGSELGVATAAAARDMLKRIAQTFAEADEKLGDVGHDLDHAAADLRIVLLERWPTLDDPWHPEFEATLAGNREAIAPVLRESDAARRYADLLVAHNEAGRAYDEAKIELARLQVLVRAYETVELVQRLHRRGGEDWQHWRALRRCERGAAPANDP